MSRQYQLEEHLQHDLTHTDASYPHPIIVTELIPKEMWQHCDVYTEYATAGGRRADIVIAVYSPHTNNDRLLGLIVVELKRGRLKIEEVEQSQQYREDLFCLHKGVYPTHAVLIGAESGSLIDSFGCLIGSSGMSVADYDLDPRTGLSIRTDHQLLLAADTVDAWVLEDMHARLKSGAR